MIYEQQHVPIHHDREPLLLRLCDSPDADASSSTGNATSNAAEATTRSGARPPKFKAPSVPMHKAFGEFLKIYVRGDTFDYDGASRDRKEFDAYVSRIAQTDPSTLAGREEKLAFYINAYNALTIASVLSFWPKIKSVSTVKPNFEFFKAPVHTLGGKKVSLDQIENKIIRPTFNDPRIHAALNCASKSCPPWLTLPLRRTD